MNSQTPKPWLPTRQKSASAIEKSGKSLTGLVVGFVTGVLFLSFVVTIVFVASISLPDLVSGFADETPPVDVAQRPIGEMRRDVEAFLKNSKSEDDLDLQVGGIIDLCFMHQEIVTDPRFSTNRQLQSIRAVAASRLKKYLKTIELKKARQSRRVKKEQIEANKKLLAGESAGNPALVKTEESTNHLPTSSDSQGGSEISDAEAIDEAMYRSMSSLGNLTGGPSQMLGYLPGRYAPPWDHGEELVNLIENTINPDFWQRNGGSGIIYYYRPSRIIVVGATSQIQDDLTNMLRNLRSLSR